MLKVGTVGTSWITEQFIEATQLLNEHYQVTGVYSRSVEKAKALAEKYQIEFYCDELNHLLYDPEIQVIYIATPNAHHYEVAKRAIRTGKHLIVEKPMFASLDEWREIHELAQEQGVLVFEAVVHTHNQNYKRLKQLVQYKLEQAKQPFLGANFSIGQYSSRYPDYVNAMAAGEVAPNVFNLAMAGGTLMDIGVYPLYVIVDLFGIPKQVKYSAITGPNKVDLMGTMILNYKEFQVSLFVSKAVHSMQPSELYFDNETIVIEGITRIDRVYLVNHHGQSAKVIDYVPKNPMLAELTDFAEVLENPTDSQQQQRYQYWTQLSWQVAQVMDSLRQSAGLDFDKAKEEETK